MLKKLLMFSAAAGALVGTHANAASFAYTGAEQTYTITTTGVYDIIAAGASGGTGGSLSYNDTFRGGLGARVEGMTTLTAGSVLDIFVGGKGGAVNPGIVHYEGGNIYGGGGGGGTFAFLQPSSSGGALSADTALIVAGGGGGGGSDPVNGGNGDATGTGGSGQGGASGYFYSGGASGGGGVSSNGGSSKGDVIFGSSQGGFSPSNGGSGGFGYYAGNEGGFGGGGGGSQSGGGGGGFTGGGGARGGQFGQAGTSYLRDSATLVSQGLNNRADGNGEFDISLAPAAVSAAPEPAAWLTMLLGLGATGLLLRRRKGMGAPRTA